MTSTVARAGLLQRVDAAIISCSKENLRALLPYYNHLNMILHSISTVFDLRGDCRLLSYLVNITICQASSSPASYIADPQKGVQPHILVPTSNMNAIDTSEQGLPKELQVR